MFKSKRYDDETLKHLQEVQIMIFKDFIKICEENDLDYYVYGGTLLGTIRHGGFIPWDDDIDVIMFRKEFDKLNKIMETNLDEKYDFYNCLNEKTYFYTFARLTLKGTLFEEWWANQVEYIPNIFIDIFILDNIPNNKIKRFFHMTTSFLLNQFTMYSYIKYENFSKLKKNIQQIAYYLLKILPISPQKIKEKCIKSYEKYKDIECSHVCDFPAMCQMPIYDKKDWLPIKKAKFESIEVNIPNNPDKILSRIYGDYMKLPPKESRFRSSPEKIDFGKY